MVLGKSSYMNVKDGVLDSADFHYTQIGTEQSEDTATEKKAVQVRDIEEYDKVTYFTEGVWRGCLDHDSQTVRISGCEGAKTSLEIPDVLWDKPVKGIGGYAFEDMKMENVTIPENIEDIDPNAFAGCENLTDIYVAESNPIYSSGDGILYNKEKTELIICPRGRQGEISNLPSSLKVMGHSSFSQCENLTSIHLPNGVVGIGGYAFYGCSMESIMLPDSLEYIQDSAFKLCWQLEMIHIPSKVKSIDSGTVFYSCNNLKAIDVSPDNPGYASEDGILYNKEKTRLILCPGNKQGELLHLPESLKSIEGSAFYNCTEITKVRLPEGVIGIGNQAFYGCYNLTEINFPEGLLSIGHWAFYMCNLSQAELPEGLKALGNFVFVGNDLTEIHLPGGLEIKGNQKL